jgi:cysteine desulfurase family protein (TIGR01976 family)
MQPKLDLDFVRGQFPGLSKGWAFFDNAGGSQITANALARITEFLTERNAQIGGSYDVSQAAQEALAAARLAGQTMVNAARPEEIVFGASTTALIQNLARAMRSQLKPGDEIIVTSFDHESNIGPWCLLSEFGIRIKVWELDRATLQPDLLDLERLLSERTRLVCVTHTSNILGSVHPIGEIAEIVHRHGARLCVDAVAYAPHRAIDVQSWDVDYYVFSLYKTYGPHYALMYGKYDCLLELDTLYHYFYGKDRVPAKLEPGNACYELAYSTVGIVDYLAELGERSGVKGTKRDRLVAGYDAITEQESALSERLIGYLRRRNDCRIVGRSDVDASRIPTIAFAIDGQNPAELVKRIDAHKVAIRFGDFHSRRLIEYLDLARNSGVLRVSMVHYNTVEEIDRLTDALDESLAA